MNIKDIEGIRTEAEARAAFAPDFEMVPVKGHNVMLVDLGESFGYSALVFAEGRHIYHANDYELHHRSKTREELKGLYIEKMERVLFTREELLSKEPMGYDEYGRKMRYVRNYHPMRRENVSVFRIGGYSREEQAFIDEALLSPVAFAYYKDRDFIKELFELFEAVTSTWEASKDPESMYKAFLAEMYNHEYQINPQRDFDVINCFASVPYCYEDDTAEHYLSEAGFTDEIKQAYYRARRECMQAELA